MKESGKLECTMMESFIWREKAKYNKYGLIRLRIFGGIISCYVKETLNFIAICSYIVKGTILGRLMLSDALNRLWILLTRG